VREFNGNTSRDLCITLAERHGLAIDADALVKLKFDILYRDFRTVFFPYARRVLEHFLGRIPMAIASNSPRHFVDLVLRNANLSSAFEVITTIDDVQRKKPDPEMINLALANLGVPAAQTVVFEDSDLGMTAALSAGCRVVLLENPGYHLPEHRPDSVAVSTWQHVAELISDHDESSRRCGCTQTPLD